MQKTLQFVGRREATDVGLLFARLGERYALCKEVPRWYGIAQPGLANTGVDFTDSLSLLVAGLVSLVWLSVGLIAILALQHYWSQPQMRSLAATSDAPEHREAA